VTGAVVNTIACLETARRQDVRGRSQVPLCARGSKITPGGQGTMGLFHCEIVKATAMLRMLRVIREMIDYILLDTLDQIQVSYANTNVNANRSKDLLTLCLLLQPSQ